MAALLGTLLVALTIAGAVIADATVERGRRDDDRVRAAADIARFDATLDVVTVTTDRVASDTAMAASNPDRRRLADTAIAASALSALVRVDPDGVVAGVDVDPGLEPGAAELAELMADATAGVREAAATGTPQVAAPVATSEGPAVVVAAAMFPPLTPVSVAARRDAVNGYLLGLLVLDDVLTPEDGEPLWAGSPVEITSPDGTVLASRDRFDAVVTDTIDVNGVPWTISVGGGDWGTGEIVGSILVLGLLGTASTVLVLRGQERRRERAEADATARARQLELIAETSTSLQQSLELSDLLPAFAVVVATEFTLESVSIDLAGEGGALVESFRLGSAPGTGERIELPLRRSWRLVGMVRAIPGRRLDDAEEQTLRALADVLAVAITNAQLYQREQEAVTRLQELDTLKNAFLGTVSHELRTSTTAVMGFGELLAENWDAMSDERRHELAVRIRRGAGSLRHLVDDLLDYARLEHDSLRVAPREASLSALVLQVVDSMRPLISAHTIELEVTEGVDAYVDPLAVERILANLLSNAAKYAPPGTTITVKVERNGDRARLRVADQGPGIPEDERSRVFVRFYRLSNPETIRTRGAGIGLAILRDFADQSNAAVTIEDAPGGGSVFTVDFPTAPVPDGVGPNGARAGEAVR